jgi:ubiquinone/menaquinone biosynthesis C-methylase UbiE
MSINYTKNSEETWDTIAQSFNSTRRKPWKQCIDFINTLPKTSIVVDIGCGNGRHLIPCAKHCKKAIGLDISRKLLSITQQKINNEKLKNIHLFHSEIVNIPIRDSSIDSVLFIATLHNIQIKDRRNRSLKEVNRILKRDSKALISVWSRWQDKYRKLFFKKWFTPIRQKEFGDIDIYWRQHGLNIPRFYHLYSKKEFISDLEKAEFKILKIQGIKIHSKKHPDNFFAVVKKH